MEMEEHPQAPAPKEIENTKRERIAIIASSECRKDPDEYPRTWFHLREFIKTYGPVLRNHDLCATNGTASIIRDVSTLPVERLGPGTKGVVKLAAMVATDKVDRVLFFQDPNDLAIERPENYALLRNCAIHGKPLCINHAARLWAKFEKWLLKRDPSKPPYFSSDKEIIAFIAHDGEKSRIARFVLAYSDLLRQFHTLKGTSGTAKYINEEIRKYEKRKKQPGQLRKLEEAGASGPNMHGPSGGDVIIADEIYTSFKMERPSQVGPLYNILFFIDFNVTHAHEPDIQLLLRTCVDPRLRVNLILHSEMARDWIERYRLVGELVE